MDQVFDIRDVVNNYFVYLRLSPLLFPSGGNAVKTICIPFGCRRSHACACAMATLPDTACNVHPVIFWEGISPAIAVLNKQKHARTHRILPFSATSSSPPSVSIHWSNPKFVFNTLHDTRHDKWVEDGDDADGRTNGGGSRECEYQRVRVREKLWLKLRVKLSSGGISRRRLSSPLTRTPHTHMLFHILYPSFRLRKRTRVFHFGIQFISFPLFLFLYWISLHTYNSPPPPLPFPFRSRTQSHRTPPSPPSPSFFTLTPLPSDPVLQFQKISGEILSNASNNNNTTTTILSKRNCFFVLPVLWGPKWWW